MILCLRSVSSVSGSWILKKLPQKAQNEDTDRIGLCRHLVLFFVIDRQIEDGDGRLILMRPFFVRPSPVSRAWESFSCLAPGLRPGLYSVARNAGRGRCARYAGLGYSTCT